MGGMKARYKPHQMAKYNQILAATAFPARELATAGQAVNAANVL